ncbi:MAG TPA: PQQ-dependent sugar dehydrogenase [Pyrinomonadaceae bacterium]|jgi:glucose/arabinose dehydrogenase
MAFAPDGRLFVCQQGGQLRVIKNNALLATPFLTVNVDSAGERGLLGVAFDPNFSTNGFVYIYYTTATSPQHNRVSRFTANGDVAIAVSETVIFELNNLSSATNHNGGAIHFGPDGKLYIAVGENANPANSQTLTNLLGKVLRINSNGTIPSDNPFFNTASGDNRAIWALGLRNPFTFDFQPGTGRMFINDVGQNIWEEINDGIAGSNYGWPTTEGPTSDPNFRSPIFAYQHGSSSTTGCAITGGTFYNPSVVQFPNTFVGSYFFADLCSGWIRRLDPSNNTVTDFASGISQPVDLKVGFDGNLYYLARGSGAVFKIAATTTPTPTPTPTPSPEPIPVTVALSANSYSVNEADPAGVVTITVNRGGVTASAFTVDFITSDQSGMTPCQNNSNGIASERCDYATAIGTLRFAAGETSKTIQIALINDAYVEPAELFTISLRNPQGATLGAITTASVTITSDDTQAATQNPIDNQAFFIREQYIDFLGRPPEAAGFNFWNNRMNNCPAGQVCDRIDTSQRFFQSDEFQERGFYVYRLYDAVLGRLPGYTEFVSDVARLNGSQTPAEQRQSKDAYLLALVNRAEFRSLYGQFLSSDGLTATDATGFVNALIARAGITPASRQTLINNLLLGARTPAQTLEDFILTPEISNVGTKFYDRGFITAQYFSYLRRDPDTNGFNFWVGQLIGANAPHRLDYRFMVGGFINSDEYRFRFALISAAP